MVVSRRTFLGASAAAFCLPVLARAASGVVRRPYLQRLLKDRVSILWTTAQLVPGSVSIIASDGTSTLFAASPTFYAPSVTQLSEGYYQYQADVTGLHAGVAYKYQVVVDGQVVASDPLLNSFTTPASGDFSFLVFGDSGADSPEQTKLIGLMAAEPGIAKVIHVGDLAYNSGTFGEFEANYFALNAQLMSRLSFFTSPGNHEYVTNQAAPYLAGHVMPESGVPSDQTGRYYSYDWGDVHFTSIDSNLLQKDAGPAMLAWLDADLAATQKFWKIVFLHHPAYPTGTHLNDPVCALVQQQVNPIVERHGVQLVLAGHEHGYERTFPLAGGVPVSGNAPSTTYVISGGGGASMEQVATLQHTALALQSWNYLRVDVSGTTLTYKAVDLNGNVIDKVTLNPPPVLTPGGVVNAGDFSQAVAPGSLVSIFGQNLTGRPAAFTAFPLPNTLGGVSVTVNGVIAPVLYASPTQINVQIPYGVSGQVTIQVTTQNGSATVATVVAPTAPSILAVISGTALNSGGNPAAPGSYVTLYTTGLGAPQGSCPTGQPATGAMSVSAAVHVTLGATTLQPSYAGLAPGFAGVGQVNFQVPPNAVAGSSVLRISAGSAVSTAATLNVGVPGGPAGPSMHASGAHDAARASLQLLNLPGRN